jgi:hypothetical protein
MDIEDHPFPQNIIAVTLSLGKVKVLTSMMDIEDHPFPQNIIAVTLSLGKVKVLTSEKAKESKAVDPDSQMTTEEYREVQSRRYQQDSQFDRAKTSKAGAVRRRLTT